MTNQRPDPLTPEERELAERVGRIAPRATPSAELDARILGAAHTAAGRKAGPPRSRPRWPALVGIAATLALAVGVVWQLRPVHEAPVERDEMPSSAMVRPTAAVAEAPVSERGLPRPAEPRATDIAAPAQSSEPRLRMLPPPAPRPSPPVVFDDPSPVSAPEVAALPAPPAAPPEPAPAPAPPPPPVPPAPPVPVMDTTAAAVNRPAAAARARPQADSKAAAMQREATDTAAAKWAADDAQAGFSIDIDAHQRTITIADVPVDSDRLLDPVDWIERIRQRRDSGDLGSARASLDALREAHPALALPDDVLAIAITAETPPER
ncbi:hypothetical protein [Lysobacter sp. F6437]|uniref:hypothetical protein n=1 Tax=Lysobacter sp. F6437 TaxID=3459296 RepID=UPI00403DC456